MACFLPFLHGQKTQPKQPSARIEADYPIKVHVSGIHIRSHCVEMFLKAYCEDKLYVDATLEGKKVDLMGNSVTMMGNSVPMQPGDYVARFKNEDSDHEPQEIGQKYEVLLSNGAVWQCQVAGFSE